MTRAYSIGATFSRKVLPVGVRRHMKKFYYRVLRPEPNVPPPLAGWGFYDTSQKQWEAEYQNGRWEYMKNLEELARYSIIVGYVDYLKKGGAILDVGCGEGI